MPGSYSLIRGDAEVRQLAVPAARMAGWNADDGYLYIEEPDSNSVTLVDPGVSQFFRRRIAERIGAPDEWDYLTFPHLENVARTIRELMGRL
jgi:hypothetical protein